MVRHSTASYDCRVRLSYLCRVIESVQKIIFPVGEKFFSNWRNSSLIKGRLIRKFCVYLPCLSSCVLLADLYGESASRPSGGGWSRMSKIPHDCKSVTNALSVGRMKPEKFRMEINGKVDERLLRVYYNCIPECALRICFILMHTFQDTCNTSVGSLFSSFPGLSQGLIRWTSGCASLRFPFVWVCKIKV